MHNIIFWNLGWEMDNRTNQRTQAGLITKDKKGTAN